MTVIINGSTGITSVNGSAAAPSVTGTDTDTGIVYGTNTLSLATGGTTAVTVDSAQNVGVGVTPSGSWGTQALMLGKSGAANPTYPFLASTDSQTINIGNNTYWNGSVWKAQFASAITATRFEISYNEFAWYNAAAVSAGTTQSFTKAMTLDASGRLLINQTSVPSSLPATLNITASSSGASAINISGRSSDNLADIYFTSNSGATNYGGIEAGPSYVAISSAVGYFQFGTAGGNARIDTSGNLLVGTTSAGGVITSVADLTAKNALYLKDTQNSTFGAGETYVVFANSAGSGAGSIQHTATTTVNYATSSDIRLKTDKGVATDTSVIDNTIIHDFEWKEDGRIDRGVFAQEAFEVKPSAVCVGTDDLTENGALETPWSVDYSKYVPELIVYCQQLKKTSQEQQALITQLQADVAALKA